MFHNQKIRNIIMLRNILYKTHYFIINIESYYIRKLEQVSCASEHIC